MKCAFCQGSRYAPNTAYTTGGGYLRDCVRCGGSGEEADAKPIHEGMLLRNRRSGKVWAVYGSYSNGRWGVHRMIPSRSGAGHYVWQIINRREAELLDRSRWTPAGFGDAWDHAKMESDPV